MPLSNEEQQALDSKLLTSIRNGNLADVKDCLKGGADPFAKESDPNKLECSGDFALHLATETGNIDIIKCLFAATKEKSKLVNSQNNFDFTPTHTLCEYYDLLGAENALKIIQLFYENGADFNIKNCYKNEEDEIKETPLQIILRKLSNPATDKEDVKTGIQLIGFLLINGANINELRDYATPLPKEIIQNPLIAWLNKRKSNNHFPTVLTRLYDTTHEGLTLNMQQGEIKYSKRKKMSLSPLNKALIEAAWNEDLEKVEEYLLEGANPFAQEEVEGFEEEGCDEECGTALHNATHRGNMKIMELLIKAVSLNRRSEFVNLPTNFGNRPIHIVCDNFETMDSDNIFQIIQLLLDNDANVNEKNSYYDRELIISRTPLQVVLNKLSDLSSEKESIETGIRLIALLIKNGANINELHEYAPSLPKEIINHSQMENLRISYYFNSYLLFKQKKEETTKAEYSPKPPQL